MYITRLASNETFSQLKKIHREVGRAKYLSAPRYCGFRFWTGKYVMESTQTIF